MCHTIWSHFKLKIQMYSKTERVGFCLFNTVVECSTIISKIIFLWHKRESKITAIAIQMEKLMLDIPINGIEYKKFICSSRKSVVKLTEFFSFDNYIASISAISNGLINNMPKPPINKIILPEIPFQCKSNGIPTKDEAKKGSSSSKKRELNTHFWRKKQKLCKSITENVHEWMKSFSFIAKT